MDQEKIGKFIQALRKEKKLTQIELAAALGVSDRAVSKWENGRGMCDVSLMQPLCKELGISVNELLSAQRLEPADYQISSERTILETLDYSQQKLKQNRRKNILMFTIAISAFLILLIYHVQSLKNMPPFYTIDFSSFTYTPTISERNEQIKQAIKDYILMINDSFQYDMEDAKNFVGMKVYGIDEYTENISYRAYAYIHEKAYKKEDDQLVSVSASSTFYRFDVLKVKGKYTVVNIDTPRDGSLYVEDMETLFPIEVKSTMDQDYDNDTFYLIAEEVEQQAKDYFHL